MDRGSTVGLEEDDPGADAGARVSTETAGSAPWVHHFRRPVERPFTALERIT